MKLELKTLSVWIALLAVCRLALLYPHRYIDDMAFLNAGLQLLLFVLCVFIAWNSTRGQRYVFLNFALFFFFVVPMLISSFIGLSLLPASKYATVYYTVYINKIGLNFILLLAIIYAVIDYLWAAKKTTLKYTAGILLAGGICAMSFYPVLDTPLSLYSAPEYVTFRQMKDAERTLSASLHHMPTNAEISEEIGRQEGQTQVGQQTRTNFQNNSVIEKLRPYLDNGGETAIFWKPVNLAAIYINLVVICTILLCLVLIYRKGIPHSAYTDKILIVFLLLCALNVLHTYGAIYSISPDAYQAVLKIAHFITIVCSLLLVYAFDLKLRFVLSVAGKYYDEAIWKSPEKVTRYRDEIDYLISKTFFKKSDLERRLVTLVHPATHSSEEKMNNE